jgi:hypothetical protein
VLFHGNFAFVCHFRLLLYLSQPDNEIQSIVIFEDGKRVLIGLVKQHLHLKLSNYFQY